MTTTVQQTETSLATRITQLVEADGIQLPPLPELALKAQRLMASATHDTRELGKLLEQDPAIVAALLRLANSAAFGGLGRVDTLPVALMRIGLRQTAAIVTGLTVKGQFQHESAQKNQLLKVLWEHSVTSAFAARSIAKLIGSDPEHAFLGGLLHDCGKVLVLASVDHLEKQGLPFTPTRELLIELMDELHPLLGCRVIVSWNLPEDLAEVALHHEEQVADATDLLLCVQAANLITRKLGFHLDPDPSLPLVDDPAIESLGLDDLTLATMMIDIEDHLQEMKRLL